MNKLIIGTIALAAILIGGAYYASTPNTAETTQPVTSAITADPATYDFGEIDIFGGNVKTTYTLVNDGAEDVTIRSGVTSCMCTEGVIDGRRFGMHGSNVDGVVIPAGGTKTLTAIFDPLAHGPNGTGPITRELSLSTNSVETPEVMLRFTGTVVKQ